MTKVRKRVAMSVMLGLPVLLALAAFAASEARPPEDSPVATCKLERVGGAGNACHCSQRIEP